MEMNFATNGKANAGLTTGIIGTALGVLNGGLFGGSFNNGAYCGDNMPVSRYEAKMMNELSAKDGEIALLKADKYTDEKIVEAYKDLAGQIGDLRNRVEYNKNEQYQVNLNQAVLNGTTNAAIGCIQQQVAQLMGLTKLIVPNGSICPGWGNVTVTPEAAATTTTG